MSKAVLKEKLAYYYHKHALQWRFLVVGGFNSLVGITLFPLLYLWLKPHHYAWLLVIAHLLCITNAFLTNKLIVFRSKGLSFWEYLRFTLYYNLIFVINLAILPLIVNWTQINPAKIQLIINIAIAIGSYFWHRHITFNDL